VTARNQIPHDTFVEAVESLDTESLVALVGEIYAVIADEVSVDGPHITVTETDRQTELLVVSDPDDLDDSEECDTVVTARDSLIADRSLPADTAVVTPADLRQRLLYAIPPDEADAITRQFLDAPVRSPAYDATSASDTATDQDTPTDDDDTPVVTEMGPQDGPSPVPGEIPEEFDTVGTVSPDQSMGASSDDAASKPSRPQPTGTSSSEPLIRGDRQWIVFGVIGLVTILGLTAIGVGFAGTGFIADGADGVAGVSDGTVTDPEPSEVAAGSGNSTAADGDDAAAISETVDRDLTNVTARATSVTPTCDRSAIHVVQLQMNAFRYNNNSTNAGILTARQFASPSNKAAVGSADQFISLFDGRQYSPMLTYDTVEYSIPRTDADTANIEVTTRENGTVTGQYDFRLTKVPSDETGIKTTRDDAECWMTSSVA
jgi:hypothetical protein